jgi:hypothetical protein
VYEILEKDLKNGNKGEKKTVNYPGKTDLWE